MVRLRGHHLFCVHFLKPEKLVGRFGEPFAEAVREAVRRLEEGEPAEVVEGPDDLCARCPYLREGRCEYEEGAEEEVRRMDADALRLLALSARLVPGGELRRAVQRALSEWKEEYCGDCELRSVCFG